VEEDVHDDDDSQVTQALQADVPHLPLFPGQVGLVGLQGEAEACHRARDLHAALLQLSQGPSGIEAPPPSHQDIHVF